MWSSSSRTLVLIQQQLSCSQCQKFTPNVFLLSPCSHLLCAECADQVRRSRACGVCGVTAGSKDVTQPPLLSNIAQSFWELQHKLILLNDNDEPVKEKHEKQPSPVHEESDHSQPNAHLQDIINEDIQIAVVVESPPRKKPPSPSAAAAPRVRILAQSSSRRSARENLDEENTFLAFCSQNSQSPSRVEYDAPAPSLPRLNSSLTPSQGFPLASFDTLSQQNTCRNLQNEIYQSKNALKQLLQPPPKAEQTPPQSLASPPSISQPLISLPLNSLPLSSLETIAPLAANSTLSLLSQQHAFRSVQKEISNSKEYLQNLLSQPNKQRPSEESAIDSSPPFTWRYNALPVIATYSSISNLLLFEEARKKGWIDSSSQPIPTEQECKMLVTEVVSEDSNEVRLVRRTLMYMKCLLLGYQIVDFTWIKHSLDAGKVLDPQLYEVHGTTQDSAFWAPQRVKALPRGSQGQLNLLEGFVFTVLNDCLSAKIKMIDVETLITLAGGTLKMDTSEADLTVDRRKHVIVSLRLKRKTQPPKSNCEKVDQVVLSVSWLLDSICNLQVLDYSDYILCDLIPE